MKTNDQDTLKQAIEVEDLYFRIGEKYWHLFKAPCMDGTTKLELHPFNKRTIVADRGRDFLKKIRAFNVAVEYDHKKRWPDVFYLCDFVKIRGKKPGRKTTYWYYILMEEGRFFQHINMVQPNYEN